MRDSCIAHAYSWAHQMLAGPASCTATDRRISIVHSCAGMAECRSAAPRSAASIDLSVRSRLASVLSRRPASRQSWRIVRRRAVTLVRVLRNKRQACSGRLSEANTTSTPHAPRTTTMEPDATGSDNASACRLATPCCLTDFTVTSCPSRHGSSAASLAMHFLDSTDRCLIPRLEPRPCLRLPATC